MDASLSCITFPPFFRSWWTSNQTDWKREIASGDVRWQAAWARHPKLALAAAEAYLASNGSEIVPCNGNLSSL